MRKHLLTTDRPTRSAAALLAMAVALPAHAQTPTRAPGQQSYDAGVALAEQKRFDEAARAFEAAYNAEPRIEALFAWAQVERLGGHCDRATPLYRKFLEAKLSPEQAQAGELGLRRCAEAAPPAPEPRPAPPATAPTVSKPAVQPAPRTRIDWTTAVLLSGGAVGLAAGGTMFAMSRAEDRSAGSAANIDGYFDRMERARLLRGLSFGAGAVGLGCFTAGVLRLWSSHRPAVAVLPDRTGVRLALGGAF